jgi:hypothetical protein
MYSKQCNVYSTIRINVLKDIKDININIVGHLITCSFYYLCGFFSLLMPYWLVYVIHVEDRFFNTFRL